MFDNYYKFDYLGKRETLGKNPISKILFRFKAKYRKYFVTVEEFSFGVFAIKYCDNKDRHNTKTAYKKIFNDGDAFRILATCVYIMFTLWKKSPSISFAFYAVPRTVDISSLKEKKIKPKHLSDFLERYKRSRFNIYEYAMLNLFPPDSFQHMKDYNNCIYVLVNRQNKDIDEVINKLGEFLLEHHQILFCPEKSVPQKKKDRHSGLGVG